MLHILFPIDNSLIDVFIGQSKEFCNRNDQFLHGVPYPFRNGQFQGVLGYVLKELADGFVCVKPLYEGEDVVLQYRQGCSRNLRGEVVGLTFAQPQQSLGFFEHDFQRPPLGINPVRLKELKLHVRGHQSVPCAPLAPLDKEQAHLGFGKNHVRHDVMTTQSPAVLSLALLVKVLDQCRCGMGFPIQKVFCLAVFPHLDHAQIIALDVAGTDEADDILAREPAVSQHIPEPDAFADGTLDHANHQVDLIPRVFIHALLHGIAAVTLFGETPGEFLVGHPELLLLPFLAQQGKIKNHLGRPVRDGKEQGLEAEDAPVLDMGKYPADVLHAPSCLGVVCVIDYQANRAFLATGTNPDSRPKLEGEVIDELPPIYFGVAHKAVEHVFLALQQAA